MGDVGGLPALLQRHAHPMSRPEVDQWPQRDGVTGGQAHPPAPGQRGEDEDPLQHGVGLADTPAWPAAEGEIGVFRRPPRRIAIRDGRIEADVRGGSAA